MTKDVYDLNKDFEKNAIITRTLYDKWYKKSEQDPIKFWTDKAQEFITWDKPWDSVLTGRFETGDVRWFSGAKLNASYNCLDRHLAQFAEQTAIIWEGDDPSLSRHLTYRELYEDVCRFANVLKKYGVKKGDRVCIYLPMIPEVAIAMLACARIGAIHVVVFAGFSAEALQTRIVDADCSLVITANEGYRGSKIIPLKKNVDEAIKNITSIHNVIVVKRTDNEEIFSEIRDIWYHKEMNQASTECLAEPMDANDPLFILYTSGSTGTPKGILHGTGGYLLYAAVTHQYVFDYKRPEVFWCTADVGWITGHTYGIYAPLLNNATTLMFEGIPNYPTPVRFWEVIDKHQVSIFYTAPTAIRALRREGDEWVKKSARTSLRLLGSVGEPINPDAWKWYYEVVGDKRCPIVDTWWQTESGGIMMSALPGATPLKAGAASWPFFGIIPNIVNEKGENVTNNGMGKLLITQPWPGIMLSVYGNQERFMAGYFKEFPGCYVTGDQAYCDADGYYWISGRSDDVIKVSGHRIGTQEVESAILHHEAVSESAVVAIPDPIKGQSIYAYVTLKVGYQATEALKDGIKQTVRSVIGAIAIPDYIQFADALPKTRSGKIMRRLLRKIAVSETHDLGDLSTLADPSVIEDLIKLLKK